MNSYDTLTQLANQIHDGDVLLANMRRDNNGARNTELGHEINLVQADVERLRREYTIARLQVEAQARGTHVQDLGTSHEADAAASRIRAVSEKLEQLYEGEAF